MSAAAALANPQILALLQAMLTGQKTGQPSAHAQLSSRTAMAKAMAGRGARVDPRWASLEALKPYGESDHADTIGAVPPAQQGAFQTDAFQNDAFQVDGVV
jgi:hypothetical protein